MRRVVACRRPAGPCADRSVCEQLARDYRVEPASMRADEHGELVAEVHSTRSRMRSVLCLTDRICWYGLFQTSDDERELAWSRAPAVYAPELRWTRSVAATLLRSSGTLVASVRYDDEMTRVACRWRSSHRLIPMRRPVTRSTRWWWRCRARRAVCCAPWSPAARCAARCRCPSCRW